MAKRNVTLTITNEEFKQKGNKKYNNKYIYDKVDVDNTDEQGRVTIICPIHGEFKVTPLEHLIGKGCPKCPNNIKRTTEEVIEEIKLVHGDRYIIPDDFEYKGNKERIHIICPEHGDFYPYYMNFVKHGNRCKQCTCHVYSNDEFINDLKNLYNNKFDYSQVEFNGYRKDVTLICNKCGKTLKARPKTLLTGSYSCDCEVDKRTVLERIVMNELDKNKIKYEYQYRNNEWLKLKESLSLDFFLPEYNVAIECQGRFHFEPYKKGVKEYEIELEKQQNRDRKKRQLCEDKGIRILYFTEKQYNNNNYLGELITNKNKLINLIKENNYGR